jgi:hypothetical protein
VCVEEADEDEAEGMGMVVKAAAAVEGDISE